VASAPRAPKKFTIELANGVSIEIDGKGNLKIKGAKSFDLSCDGEIKLRGETVNIQAKKDLYMGAEHAVSQSKTLHFNPLNKTKRKSGYGKKRSALRRTQTRRR
jgi:hypothetical protein